MEGTAWFQREIGRNAHSPSVIHYLCSGRESCALDSDSIDQSVKKQNSNCNANVDPAIRMMKEEKNKSSRLQKHMEAQERLIPALAKAG